MLWRRRSGTQLLILLIGGTVLFVEWMDSVGRGFSRLPQRQTPYSSDNPQDEPRHQRGYSYFQKPYRIGNFEAMLRQGPDRLGLDDSLIHMEPEWSYVEQSRPTDDELLRQPFELWEYGVIPAQDELYPWPPEY
ncbi:hypothetical protein KDL29_08010 [bacterium]|nr:hypothetical protein [bacterium]UNM09170.1 MAG: hypothetical protein H7A35_03750 [Planctomycetales bacterium]